MKVGIMQPYLFPYLGYWQLINAVDEFIIYDDVNYIKRGWINRNRIIVNRQEYTFTLPVQKASQNRKINEHSFVGTEEKRKLWKTIELAYSHTPMWGDISVFMKEIILNPEENVAKYIGNSIIRLSAYLGMNTQIKYSSDIVKDNSLKGEDKIIEICEKEHADIYINPQGGIHLYAYDKFQSHHMELLFLFPQLNPYAQQTDAFIPGLSIIDIIANNNLEEISKHLAAYQLKRGGSFFE